MNKVFSILLVIMIANSVSCNRKTQFVINKQVPVFNTWNSLEEMRYYEATRPVPENDLPQGFFPWAGIASHHILAHEYIDAWFSRLAEIREVKTFYILSPDHNDVSAQSFALTDGSWDSGFGLVQSDIKKVNRLAKKLDVDLDSNLFTIEHGVSSLIPYIKKHFPLSKVVAIACDVISPVNTLITGKLARVLDNEFDKNGKSENFLLISADYSHKGNSVVTKNNDSYSRKYLENTSSVPWNIIYCDNRPSIYILDYLGRKNLQSVIYYHANSYEISGQGEDDITSYFFVYFADSP